MKTLYYCFSIHHITFILNKLLPYSVIHLSHIHYKAHTAFLYRTSQ